VAGLKPGLLVLLALLPVLQGCQKDTEFDYCKNHYEVHAGHADSIGHLEADLDAAGLLQVSLRLPAGTFSGGGDSTLLAELLQSPGRVYRIDSAQACSTPTVRVLEADSGVAIEYLSDCGPDNRISQVNVELFELLDGLEEVEVQVNTPATQKHFAISRLCERAIFRLQSPH
jgi:hypothetical protein